MARSLLVVALIALLPAGFAGAEPSASPAPSPSSTPGDSSKKDNAGARDDAEGPFKAFRDKLDKMSPKEREQFKQNWQRWKEMGDRERKDWQQRACEERDRVKKCIDEAIAKAGLTLDNDQREVFVVRYRQERRKIEEQLRQEMDAKRQEKIDEMLARLKTEFSTAPKPAASPEKPPTASPSATP
jgi:hypothetical protein